MTDTITAYVTKFALETGQVHEVEVTRKNAHYCVSRHNGVETQYQWGKDAFESRSDAVAAAQKSIDRKVAEHQRIVDRLRGYSL